MIFTRRFLFLFALGLAPFLVLWWGWGQISLARWSLLIYDLGLGVLAAIDWKRAEDPSTWEVSRILPTRLMLGEENQILIAVSMPPGRPLTLQIKDEYPPELEWRGESPLIVPTRRRGLHGQKAEAGYRLYAGNRGDYHFGDIVFRWAAPWGLVIKQARHPAAAHCKVYPNLNEARRHELSARRNRQLLLGSRRSRLRGQGREFESLRDYVPGDELRHVSWTATARRGRLTTRQYQVERNQSIVVMIDAGRLMTSRLDRLTKLDHAINAALSIGNVATSGGDNVGLLVFDRQVVNYLPPKKGHAQLLAMLEALYNVKALMIEPSYARAFQYFSRYCKKRSLVVILTDLVDRDASAELLAYTTALLPHHLPLIVTIGDNDLRAMVGRPPADVREVYRQSVAEELLQQREEALGRIVELGGLALDVPAGELSLHLVNKYLEVKERGLL